MTPVLSAKQILVLDGHDGAGKTTLARSLAHALNATYVYPFRGPRGSDILRTAEAGDFDTAQALARGLLETALDQHAGPLLVLDRHWLTVFTLLPEDYWEAWTPFPATTLCWAELDVTLARLRKRDEESRPAMWHTYYIDLYRDLGRRFDVNFLDTTQLSEDAALRKLLDWSLKVLERSPMPLCQERFIAHQ